MWSLIASRVAYIFKLLVNRVRPALENIPAGFLGLRCVGVFLRGRNDFNARQRAASLCGRTTAAFQKATTDPRSESKSQPRDEEVLQEYGYER